MIYTLTLNPAIDHVVKLDKLEIGETNRMHEENISAGGKGINVSKILKNLGENSIVLGYIAGFTGNEIDRILKEEGLSTDFIYIRDGFTRINTKIKSEKETEINGPGLKISKQEIEKLFDKLDDIKDGDYLFLSGSIPSSMDNGFYAKIMERLFSKNVNIAVDTTGGALVKTLKYSPKIIKPNLRELEELFNCQIAENVQIERYSKRLQEMGAKNIIISMGGDGAYFLSEKGDSIFLEAPKGNVIDTVGSGDSMLAGFIFALKNNFSLVEAFKFSVSCGSATAFSEKLATKNEIYKIYKNL
ncbi:1-phosphofructokinase [Helcococcus ovis]|uniref:Tagatose-6-phosphate kinase n=1 Tax=Helcococcus ovis TaxID=72026 RepID=A0A4R9C068_9FIRM|nr:1-phosphofructokinase [Helcococcus ovis]TFF63952.1 1-phosphofructokinase [Helcococcus ovis]TFF65000.1 1-phosphofructokinase [Helcococcus ovis]